MQERLTNIRFADDLLIFAKSIDEAIYMLDTLVDTFREYGLELNSKKTKLLSTTTITEDTILVEQLAGFIEIIASNRTHKYFGRA